MELDHTDHVNLLRDGIDRPGGVWADLGAGQGAFTLALAYLLGPEGEIYTVDLDATALRANEKAMQGRFPQVPVHYQVAGLHLAARASPRRRNRHGQLTALPV